MMNDRQIAKLNKRIATALDEVDNVQAEISLSELGMYAKFRPPEMLQMIADEQERSGSTEPEAAVRIMAHWRVLLNARLARAQTRVDELKARLARNGTPYTPPVMEQRFALSLEAELADCEQLINAGNEMLAARREHGDDSGIDDDQALIIIAGLRGYSSRRRTILRLLGRPADGA